MSRRLAWLVAAAAVGAVGDIGDGWATPAASRPIPYLAPIRQEAPERDWPAAVRARYERKQRAAFARLKAAAKLPLTRAAGCEESGIQGAPSGLGPPAPKVNARVLGHDVEVVFTFSRMPASAACRPAGLEVAIAGVGVRSTGPIPSVGDYALGPSRGRVVLGLPWYTRAPYRLILYAITVNGHRSRKVEVPLRCPGTGDPVKGCLPGYAPPLHGGSPPKPVLPVRGLDRSTLEASLRYLLAGEQTPPDVRDARCPSLSLCEVTYVDPLFPRSRYRVRYRIAGEQIAGCWMALEPKVVDPLPYEDAPTGQPQAACASWLHS